MWNQEREITDRFIEDALKEWDRMVGLVPRWDIFLREYVKRRWCELVREN